MKTTTDNQTASAPETRTYNDADREAIARGNATAKRINAQAKADKRTIPAEKPTDSNPNTEATSTATLVLNAESWRKVALRREAHAAGLAEALRISTTTLETVYGNDHTNIAAKCCVERNRKALAAYESEVQQ